MLVGVKVQKSGHDMILTLYIEDNQHVKNPTAFVIEASSSPLPSDATGAQRYGLRLDGGGPTWNDGSNLAIYLVLSRCSSSLRFVATGVVWTFATTLERTARRTSI